MVDRVLRKTAATTSRRWIGAAVARKEDQALLTGQARFIDDLSPIPGLRFAAILRSPHPHAQIRRIDVAQARELPGVWSIATGKDIQDLIGPVPSVVKAPLAYYPIAIDKARYVGEPVAVVIADTRYIAEDACELIQVEYEVLPAVSDLRSATLREAAVIHEDVGSNLISRRSFSYGNPDAAFAVADRTFEFSYSFPRYASTPIETLGVIAQFERAPDRYTVWSNFQGPFVVQPLMANALRVPGHRLRLITPPNSGGSFGIKQAALSYIVLMAAVSRKAGVPVKWIEDRAEHLTAASASSDRLGTVASFLLAC
jgi:2-furoyl-CoA dehydrogenase large subunit